MAAYESLADGVTLGNLHYREMFFNPTLHTRRRVPLAVVIDGLIDGISDAETDLGVQCRLIADVYRQDHPSVARQMVEDLLAYRRPELIGLGMDGAEAPDPPEKFVEAFRLAGSHGLRLTSHACEDGPPENVITCLDVLGCERHRPRLSRARPRPRSPAGAVTAGCSLRAAPPRRASCTAGPTSARTPSGKWSRSGLRVTINSDDPTMFHTDIGEEYVRLCTALDYGADQVEAFALAGVDAAWLDDVERASMRASFITELEVLAAELEGLDGPPGRS